MSVIREIRGYRTSSDYGRLWELLQRQSVICLVGLGVQHLARTEFEEQLAGPVVAVGLRGHNYFVAYDLPDAAAREMFVQACESVDLEWLVPEEMAP